jgi:hypothetical protein
VSAESDAGNPGVTDNISIVHVGTDRSMLICPLSPLTNDQLTLLRQPFAALLPSFEEADVAAGMTMVVALVELGCIELCCIGPGSERFHDRIDEVVEDMQRTDIVTTWHADVEDGVEYFVGFAGAGASCLVAFAANHAELAGCLAREAASVRDRLPE